MALPSLDNPADKGQVQEIVADIATAVFKSAKVSLESAAKMVVPSVPEMVDDVLEDLKSGSIQKFNLAMDKLDKLVNKLGIDLKQYNKELANFAARREEKIIKSEEKIQTLKEKNVIAEITKTGDIKILSNREIEARKDNLDILENNINKLEKTIEKDRKLVQESDKLKTTAQFKAKKDLEENVILLDEKKKERDKEKDILGDRGEGQPGIIQRVSGGMDTVADYLPDQLVEIGSAFKEGLMAPFTAIQELGMQFGQLLKPLKLLRPLFTGIIGSLKRFAAGLAASVIAFLPYLAIGALVIGALTALYLAFKKAKDFFSIGDGGEGGAGDIAAEASMSNIGDNDVAEEGSIANKKMRTYVVDPVSKEIIQGDDPRYDEVYKKVTGKEAPEKNAYFIDGEKQILPMTDDGELIKSSNFMENRMNLKSPEKLKPVETSTSKNEASIIDGSSRVINNNNTYTGIGLNGARDKDLELFHMAHPLYAS